MASPAASKAQIIVLWKAAVDILEVFRVHADDVQAVGGGKFDTLETALVGTFTPTPLAQAVTDFRATLSANLSIETIRKFLDPIILEWGLIIDEDSDQNGFTYGGSYTTPEAILEAMYEYFVADTTGGEQRIESRQITYDTSFTYGAINGSLVGAGKLRRCTVDENAYNLEACTIEKKHFRCRQDSNTGVDQEAELFEYLGSSQPRDNLRAVDHGAADPEAKTLISLNAGGGSGQSGGGSMLSNSSFQSFTSTADPRFDNWEESFTGASVTGDLTQSTVVYRSFPGESSSGARSCQMAMDNTNDQITLKQTVANMAVNQLDNAQPYFLRVMVRDGDSAAVGGTLTLKLGSIAATGTATMSAGSLDSNWTELFLPLDKDAWFKNFNEDPLDVEISWDGGTSGNVLWDDMILAPMTLIDGTYYCITQNQAIPTRWLVDDTIELEDTGTLGNGKLQYYLNLAYKRYLPSTSGTPTILDP